MIEITNDEFLKTLFFKDGDHRFAHVTSFVDDPSDIAPDRRGICWAGGYYHNTILQPGTNQYYTISTFMPDANGRPRRQKALFRYTHVIVADDVREKLPVEQVEKLPVPTFKLETSPGSEQWGWVLDTPCQDMNVVDNLLDGLVEKGLAPDSKDPGMKGVTRYVRLPEGYNTKQTRVDANGGTPPKCQMVEWTPEIRVSIEDLARPFDIDLNAERRATRVDGASDIPDHPLLHSGLTIKEVRSDGRFDITCPWIDGHTAESDDGAAIFTNDDGSIGFKCHHGSCQHRTARDLLGHVEEITPGFGERLNTWKVMRSFKDMATVPTGGEEVARTFTGLQPYISGDAGAVQTVFTPEDFIGEVAQPEMLSYQDLVDELKRIPAHTIQATEIAYRILQAVDNLDYGSRLNWWNQVRSYMGWSKNDLTSILDQQRPVWYPREAAQGDFYMDYIYVSEQNQFYNPHKRMWLTAEAFQNTFGHHDAEARSEALISGRIRKVDRVDYAPGMPEIFTEQGVVYLNGWGGDTERGVPGDARRWFDHFKTLGWEDDREHILKWMAFTLRHPERKINHMLILGGGEGNGKDYLLYPLIRAMGGETTTIAGDELLSDFNDYLLGTKYLHINEAELGDRKGAELIHNKCKPLASSPPDKLRVNPKGVKPIAVRNIVNCTMTTNSAVPIGVKNASRRYYAVWTDLSIRDENGQVTKEWQEYWNDRWNWMRDCEGWKACVDYLMTEVDLSNFDPKASPYVTDFLKSIQEASEDPVATVLRYFIDNSVGYMSSDIVTTKDIFNTLKLNDIGQSGVDLKYMPSANSIGKILQQNGLGVNTKMYNPEDGREIRVWIIRDNNMYSVMKGKELFLKYKMQMDYIRSGMHLKLVTKDTK